MISADDMSSNLRLLAPLIIVPYLVDSRNDFLRIQKIDYQVYRQVYQINL